MSNVVRVYSYDVVGRSGVGVIDDNSLFEEVEKFLTGGYWPTGVRDLTWVDVVGTLAEGRETDNEWIRSCIKDFKVEGDV